MKRIRYISKYAEPMTTQDIEALVAQAQKNNEERDITGILVTTGQLFFQIIEGPDAEIDEIFARIAADTRHQHVLVLSVEQGDLMRLCPDWSMRKVDLGLESFARTEPIRILLQMCYVQRQLVDQATGALENYVLRELILAEEEALSSEPS